MGVHIEKLGLQTARKYQKNIKRLAEAIQHRIFTAPLHYDFIYWLSGKMRKAKDITRPVHAFTSKIIQERRSMSRSNEPVHAQDNEEVDDNDNM